MAYLAELPAKFYSAGFRQESQGEGKDLHFGFNINFDNNNINNVINPSSADFNLSLEDTLKEAGLSLGPHETLQEAYTSSVSHLSPLKLANKNSDALTLAEASIPGNSTCQELVSTHSNKMCAQK